MPDLVVIWDLDNEPDGNVQHISEHGITKETVRPITAYEARKPRGI